MAETEQEERVTLNGLAQSVLMEADAALGEGDYDSLLKLSEVFKNLVEKRHG